MIKQTLVSALCASLLAGPAFAAAPLDSLSHLPSAKGAVRAPGCAAGAFRQGKAIFVGARGYADVEQARPIDADTLFYSGSLAKQFTALAIVMLAEKGKLNLDDDIRKYLPEMPPYASAITIRMLLSHTAGVGEMLNILRQAGFESGARADRKTAFALQTRQRGTNFMPGTAFSYSNGGYLLLSYIVERTGGMPFPQYMKQEIFNPLGMTSTYVLNDDEPKGPHVAHGYSGASEGFALRDDYPHYGGSGGIMISLNDFAKWDHEIAAGHRLWTPAVEKIMTTPGSFTSGASVYDPAAGLYYAAGLRVGWRRGQFIIRHGGTANGFLNTYERLPQRGLSIVVLCNRGDAAPQDRADEILEAIEGPILLPRGAPASPQGTYTSSEVQARYELTMSGDTLTASAHSLINPSGSMTTIFKRQADGSYTSKSLRLVFDPDQGGFLLHASGTPDVHFERMYAPDR